jgi:hypothetical protein
MKSHYPKLNDTNTRLYYYLDEIIHFKSDKIKFFCNFLGIYIKATFKSIIAGIL